MALLTVFLLSVELCCWFNIIDGAGVVFSSVLYVVCIVVVAVVSLGMLLRVSPYNNDCCCVGSLTGFGYDKSCCGVSVRWCLLLQVCACLRASFSVPSSSFGAEEQSMRCLNALIPAVASC